MTKLLKGLVHIPKTERKRDTNELIEKAIQMLRGKMCANGGWTIDKPNTDLIVPMGKRNPANDFVSERARKVLTHWDNLQ